MNAEACWEEMIRQGGADFPPGWGRMMTDAAYWQPAVAAICAAHNLPFAGTMIPGVEGSHAVFLTPDFVVKIYAAPWPVWFAREVECLRVLEAVPEARAPRLLAQGQATNGDAAHPYLVMERLPGEPLSACWEGMNPSERCSVAAQIGPMVRALHAAPIESLEAFPKAPSAWVRRMRARAANCARFLHEYNLAPHLEAELPRFLPENLHLITEDFRPCLLNADLHGDHILVERRAGGWQVTGQIDFGDAEVGPVEYEWFALCIDAFRGDKDVMRAFFAAYGWPLPMEAATRQRVKLTMLLHTFPNIGKCAELAGKPTDAPTLDALLDSFWPD
ncbi:MAG TPA: aminoglycoside phosphotransferase family protein [Chthonomonadaceae bacterium]|nr:aminoglycoside phosphotransferase family protein [Chthonomonadaceae bacterium]